MQITSASNSTRKAAMVAISLSFALGISGYVSAQEYEIPAATQEEQEKPEMSREELLEQQARQALEENQPTDYRGHSLTEMLGSEAYFSRFRQALEQTGLINELEPDQDYTIFAPFDEALSRLPEGVWENWTEGNDSDQFRDFIAHHIVEGAINSDDLDSDAREVTTMSGETIRLRSAYGAIMVDHVSVNMPNIETNQGYVHGIDAVIDDTTQLFTRSDE